MYSVKIKMGWKINFSWNVSCGSFDGRFYYKIIEQGSIEIRRCIGNWVEWKLYEIPLKILMVSYV